MSVTSSIETGHIEGSRRLMSPRFRFDVTFS